MPVALCYKVVVPGPVAFAAIQTNTLAMRFNPLPFVFAPGIGVVGYVLGGVGGAQSALAAWLLLISAASVWTLARGPQEDPDAGR